MSRERYWRDMSRLTIQDAALFLMGIADPDAHRFSWNESDSYYLWFEVIGNDPYYDKVSTVIDAIEMGRINMTQEIRNKHGLLQADSCLLKSSFIDWCNENGYQAIAKSIAPIGLKSDEKNEPIKVPQTRNRAKVLERHRELSRSSKKPTQLLALELGVTECRVRQLLQAAKRQQVDQNSANPFIQQLNNATSRGK